MAKKGTKIRRYGSIYGRGAGSLPIIIAMLGGLLLFGVIGWSLYTPIHDFVMHIGDVPAQAASASAPASLPESKQPEASSTPAPSSSSAASSAPVSSSAAETPSSSAAASSTAEEPQPQPVDDGRFKGIFIPTEQLLDKTVLASSLQNAYDAGFNTVVVDAKDATGTVLFESDAKVGEKTAVSAEAVYSARGASGDIKAKKLIPAARIHAFRDSLTPLLDRDVAVHYYDTDVYWLDNSAEAGGKTWLNPYSPEAQQFIADLAEELCSQGFEVILLDSVQFPTGYALNKAGYGEAAKTVSRSQVLTDFVKKIERITDAHGAKLMLCSGTDWIASGDEAADKLIEAQNALVYGGSPTAFFTGKVLLNVPVSRESWKQTLSAASLASGSVDWIGLVPAYAPDGAVIDSAEVIKALDDAGENEYLLYNPLGNYKLK